MTEVLACVEMNAEFRSTLIIHKHTDCVGYFLDEPCTDRKKMCVFLQYLLVHIRKKSRGQCQKKEGANPGKLFWGCWLC